VFYGSLCVAKQPRQEANSGLSSYMYFIHAVILEGSIVGYFTNRIGRIPTKAPKKRGKGTTSHHLNNCTANISFSPTKEKVKTSYSD